MKILISFCFFLCCINLVYSQANFKIEGSVVNQEGELLHGNVLILNEKKELLKGAFFLDGKIDVEIKNPDAWFVKISSIVCNDTIISISNRTNNFIDLGNIVLNDSKLLDEVLISANLPIFESTPNGDIKINIQNTMLVSSSSILDVLSKTPNVFVDEKVVSVVGKGEASLYLNGRQASLEKILSIPVNRIDKIEVITSPSAKYDAKNSAVINIITLRNNESGFMGKVNHNSTLANHYLSSTGIGINFQNKKLTLSSDFEIDGGTDWNKSEIIRNISDNENKIISSSKNNHVENVKIAKGLKYRLGIEYRINKRNDLSVEYEGLNNKYDLDINAHNYFNVNTQNDFTLITKNEGKTKTKNHSFSLNYNNKLDSLGSGFFGGLQYSDYKNRMNDLIHEINTQGDEQKDEFVNNVGYSKIKLFVSQLDYNKIWNNDKTLQAGVKYSYANNVGMAEVKNFIGQMANTQSYNNFDYDERIASGYIQYSGSISTNINYNIGLRSEYSNLKGVSKKSNTTVIDSSYIDVFPNLSLGYKINDSWNATISLSSRINRPQYQALDPFIWYQDSLTSVQGNPFLVPEKSYSYEGVVNYKYYSLKVGYTYAKNSYRIVGMRGENGDNSIIMKYLNVKNNKSIFTSLSIPINIGKMSSYNTISLNFSKIDDKRDEFNFKKAIPQVYWYSYNNINLNWCKVEVFGYFLGAKNDGIYYINPRGSVSLGLSKDLLDNNLNIRIIGNDLFKTEKIKGHYTFGNTEIRYNQYYNPHYIRLSISYNFGFLKKVNYENKSIGENEFNRIRR